MHSKRHPFFSFRWLAIPTAVLLCLAAAPPSGIGQETFGIPAGSYDDARGVLDRAVRGDEGEHARPLGRQPSELTGRERRRQDRQAFDFMAFGERFVKDNQERLAGLSKLEQAKEGYRAYLKFLDSRDAPVSESWLDRFVDALVRTDHRRLTCGQHVLNVQALFQGMGLAAGENVGSITMSNESIGTRGIRTFGGVDVHMADHGAAWFRDQEGVVWVFDAWEHGMVRKNEGKRPYAGDPSFVSPARRVDDWTRAWLPTFERLSAHGGLPIEQLRSLGPVSGDTEACERCKGKGWSTSDGIDDV